MRKMTKDNRLLLLIASFGVVAFILVTAIAPFRNRLFSLLYPKPPSQAYHQAFDVLDAAGNPLAKVSENQFTTQSLDVVIKLKDANALLLDTTSSEPAPVSSPISSSAVDNDGDGYQVGPIGTTCPNGRLCDCYDSNAKAFPGQGSYFTTHRGDGSFDYDCNGTNNLQPVGWANKPSSTQWRTNTSCNVTPTWNEPGTFTCGATCNILPHPGFIGCCLANATATVYDSTTSCTTTAWIPSCTSVGGTIATCR